MENGPFLAYLPMEDCDFPVRKSLRVSKPELHLLSHDGSMYGIYANIGGILMVNVTPLIWHTYGSVMGYELPFAIVVR